MSVSCDRSQARQYSDEHGRYYSVSQVLDVLRTGTRWADQGAMERGTSLHRLFALSVAAHAGLCKPPAIPDEYQGHMQSVQAWITTANPEPIEIEQPHVATKGLMYAGTPDLICWIHDNNKRVRCVVDYKSGQPERLHRVQVQAYGKLVQADRLALLYSDKDGGLPSWRIVKPDPSDWAGFNAALSILIYRESL